MGYLKFDKNELVNLEYSLQREILATNRTGGYCSTTVVCCNTRKYHGLLVVPIESFGGENHVLLSSLDETIVQHGQVFNLGIHKYPGIYEPRGHKYITDLSYDPLFTLKYTASLGPIILKLAFSNLQASFKASLLTKLIFESLNIIFNIFLNGGLSNNLLCLISSS